MNKIYDVVGIGSPLLDFIIEVDDDFLAEIGLTKGTMRLIDKDESARILNFLTGRQFMIAPGGSAANTIAGVSMLGGKTAFIGKIGNDEHGGMYVEQTTASGVEARLLVHNTLATGHAITFITSDGERTFATHLGASQDFQEEDIIEEVIATSKFLHCEGYQMEDPKARSAIIHAMAIAKKHNTLISIDLSDAGVIARNLEEITKVLNTYVDIVFVNEVEAEALTGNVAEVAIDTIATLCDVAVVKVGGGGSYIKTLGKLHKIPVYFAKVVNTNGAGDMYAAGVLYALTHGILPEQAGHIASFAASRIVAQNEARLNEISRNEALNFISQLKE